MAVTSAVATVVAAAAATTGAVMNYEAQQDAANAAKNARDEQMQRLKREQDDATALAASQAVTGQTFAKEESSKLAVTGFGFASGGSGSPTGFGRAQLVEGLK